jgi:hypothetical protein
MMFHLLTRFPINSAELEKHYITNVLKKPQCINIRQFVNCVEQLNAYIPQMPCFYYSPNANTNTKPENVLFMEAELGSHVLCMCPIQWQDQYNLNKKGMIPMDMRLLLTFGSNQIRLHLQEGQIRIFQEVFQKGREREETPWYQFYGQGSQESLF